MTRRKQICPKKMKCDVSNRVNETAAPPCSYSIKVKQEPPGEVQETVPNGGEDDVPLDLTCKNNSRSALSSISSNSARSLVHSHSSRTCSSSSSLTSLETKFGGNSSIIEKLSNALGNTKNPLYNAFGGNLYTSALYNTTPLMTTDQIYTPERKYWPLSASAKVPSKSSRPSQAQEPSATSKNFTNANSPTAAPPTKRPKLDSLIPSSSVIPVDGSNKDDPLKYTNLTCSCKKQYETLYELTIHMQRSGHVANTVKVNEHLEYPKLVRGQDMWLNQGSEQTRQILRCMQCAESFKSLPELTIHMIKTKHYTNIVGGDSKKNHRCLNYCEKCDDTNRSVFRCKVCQERFTDMEHLADHMMVSGHYMKTPKHDVCREEDQESGDDGDLIGRGYSTGEHVHHHADDKSSSCDSSGNDDVDMNSNDRRSSNTIQCENCDRHIETQEFVEHVRKCIKQNLSSAVSLQEECTVTSSNADQNAESDSKGTESKETGKISPITTQKPVAFCGAQSKFCSLQDKYLKPESPPSKLCDSFMSSLKKCIDKHTRVSPKRQLPSNHPAQISKYNHFKNFHYPKQHLQCATAKIDGSQNKPTEFDKITNKISSEMKSPTLIKRESSDPTDLRTTTDNREQSSTPRKAPTPLLHGVGSSESDGNSALEAMQSFIERSFHNNGVAVCSADKKSACKAPKGPASKSKSCPNYQIPDSTANVGEKLQRKGHSTALQHTKHSFTRKEECAKKTSKGKSDARDKHSSSSVLPLHNAPLYRKYLSGDNRSDSSALESLRGLVYGESVESEHPLDSLEKLIYTTDRAKPRSGSTPSGAGGKSTSMSTVVTSTMLPSSCGLPSTVILVNPIVTVMSNNESDHPRLQIDISTTRNRSPSYEPASHPSSPAACTSPPSTTSIRSPSPGRRPHKSSASNGACSAVSSPSSPTSSQNGGEHRSGGEGGRTSSCYSPSSSSSPHQRLCSSSPSEVRHSPKLDDLLCSCCDLRFASRSEYRLHQRYCPAASKSGVRLMSTTDTPAPAAAAAAARVLLDQAS